MHAPRLGRPRLLCALVVSGCVFASGCVKAGATMVGPAPATSELASASRYETEPPAGQAFTGPVGPQVEQGVMEAAQKAGRTLTPDPRLGALGRWLAQFWAVHGRFPMAEAIDHEAHRIGLVEPVPSVGLMGTKIDASLSGRVAEQVSAMLARGQYTHVGAASEESGTHARVVLVLSTRPLQLSPVPTAPGIQRPIELRGELTDGYRKPELIVVEPEGQSTRRVLSEGTAIEAQIDTPVVGPYQVELVADGPHGITVVANFPVYSGIRPRPAPPPLPMQSQSAGTPDAMRNAMLTLVNDTREANGVPPVALDGPLTGIAAAHNRDMRDNSFVGHVSKTTGKPEERVRAAGIRAPIIAENVGRGYSLEEIHRGLMGSPGHRDNLLHPRVTHVGIDVLATHEDGRTEYLVTEVFTRVIPVLEDSDVARVVDLVNDERERQGLAPVAVDETLTRLAANAARRHFAQPTLTPEGNMQALKADRKGIALPYSGLSQTLSVVIAVEELTALQPLLDPRARAVGVGLAQGDRPDIDVPNALVGVVLVGY